MADARKVLDALLQADRAALEEIARLRRAALNFDTLPNEVLEKIFLASLPSLADGPAPPSHDETVAPMQLIHVCRRWRDVAEALPALWRALHIRVVRQGAGLDAFMHVLGAWLESGTSPHRVPEMHFTLSDKHQKDWGPAPDARIHVQVNNSIGHPLVGKWITRLTLLDPPMHRLRDLDPGSFPALTRLVHRGSFRLGTASRVRAFEGSARLTHLAVSDWVDAADVDRYIVLPWHQLTHFINACSESQPPYSFMRATLPRCHALQYLHIGLTFFNTDAWCEFCSI